MDDVRLFVAIPAPREMHQRLVAAGLRLKQRLNEEPPPGPTVNGGARSPEGGVRVRLIPPENIHLTLVFLGDTPSAEIPALQQVLARVAEAIPQPRFRLGAGGVFPARGNPRVAWCGAEDLDGSLHGTAEAVASAVGRKLDRFRPHFTLGYLKGRDYHRVVRPAVTAACPETGKQEFHAAQEMVLFESRLRPSGAEHVALRRYTFDGDS